MPIENFISNSDNFNILALDLATKCGYAHTCQTKKIISGVWDFAIKRDESQGMKLFRLAKQISYVYHTYEIQLIVFEAARNVMRGGAVIHHAELQSVVKLLAIQWKIDYKGYSPSAIKKHATDNGRASKEDMVISAIKRFGKSDKLTDDEADALWLLDLVRKEIVID